MWEQTFKRWIDLVFWWLPKPEATQQPAPPAAARAPKQTAPQVRAPAAGGSPAKGAPQAKEVTAPRPAKQTPQGQAPAARAVPEQATSAPAAASSAPDDLTVIKGIGPVVQEKLHALGIRTFDDLAAADPETLVEQLKGRQPISQGLVRSWTKAADQHSAARH
jgi:predicted flap endonuclease-1-like 5' DNA nuclease